MKQSNKRNESSEGGRNESSEGGRNESSERKLIGSGGYGCVYKPEFKCSTKSNNSELVLNTNIQTISKIQYLTENEYYFLQSITNKESEKKGEIIDEKKVLNSTESGFLNEIYFGKIIKTIPNYYMYFAPILNYCFIDINSLNTKEILNCFFENNTGFNEDYDSSLKNKKYVNSTIQYIEGSTLLNYFKTILIENSVKKNILHFSSNLEYTNHKTKLESSDNESQTAIINTKKINGGGIEKNSDSLDTYVNQNYESDKPVLAVKPSMPVFFIKKLTQTYRYLFKSIQLLQKGPSSENIITHYDLKNQNIIYDKKKGIPIIIDFGISFNKKNLFEFTHPKELCKIFYTFYKAFWWCLDIIIISYIMCVKIKPEHFTNITEFDDIIKKNYETGIVNVDELKRICDDFIDKNVIFKEIENLKGSYIDFRKRVKDQWYSYIESFEGKVWRDIISDLSKRYIYWDIYSISITYLEYLYIFGFLNGDYEIPVFVDEIITNLHISDLHKNELQKTIT